MFTLLYWCYLMHLRLKFHVSSFFMTECWHSRPYRNTVIMFTTQTSQKRASRKQKIQRHLKKTWRVICRFLRQPKIQRLYSQQMKWRMKFSTITFQFFQIFLRWMRFNISKIQKKSIKKYDNGDVVVNSNDKGLRMMRFVHDLQVYKDPQKIVFVRACCWTSYKRDREYKIKLTVQGGNTCTDKIKSAFC